MSGGFQYGGWTVPYWDEFSGKIMNEQMGMPFDLLLGRRTYDLFSGYWPKQDPTNPIAAAFNKATKYVISASSPALNWEKSVLLQDELLTKLKALKQEDGPMLQVHGSANMIQTLLRYDLIDELWLKIFPVVLVNGKRLFADGAMATAYELMDSKVSPKGVIFANYKRAGNVTTGSFD